MTIHRIGTIGEIIDYLNESYSKGQVVGIAVSIKTKENGTESHSVGDMTFMWHGFGNYAEQVGAAVMLQESMLKKIWNGDS